MNAGVAHYYQQKAGQNNVRLTHSHGFELTQSKQPNHPNQIKLVAR
jgi:hypothetical protein